MESLVGMGIYRVHSSKWAFMLKTSGGVCFGGEDGYHPPQPSGLDTACPIAVCSQERFRRIVQEEMVRLPSTLELGLSGEGK